MSLSPKPQAASHMFWFFLLPCIAFMGWASYKLIGGLAQKAPPKVGLLAKVEKIKTARSPGDRWQSAYAVSQELQQMIRADKFTDMNLVDKSALYAEINSLLETHSSDARLNKYLLLTLGQMGDPMGLESLEKQLDNADSELKFFATWSFVEILSKHPEQLTKQRKSRIEALLESPDASLQKIATTFLVQQNDPTINKRIQALLKSSDQEIRWNAAVALASVKDQSSAPILREMLDLNTLRALQLNSKRDLEQLVATAAEAAAKLNDPETNRLVDQLSEQSNPQSPEGRAILSGLRAAKSQKN